MPDAVERIVQSLNERQRRTVLGVGGVGERITVRTDDIQLFEGLGLVHHGGGILQLTDFGERVVDRLRVESRPDRPRRDGSARGS